MNDNHPTHRAFGTHVPAPPPLAEPARRVSKAWIGTFALAWFGFWIANLTPFQLILPEQIQLATGTATPTGATGAAAPDAPATAWIPTVLGFGVVSGIAGIFTALSFPFAGALSDRTLSRFGRRRPWLVGGAVLAAVALVILSRMHNIVLIGCFWTIASVGMGFMMMALTAMISDEVPINQRGTVSSWMSAPNALGVICGMLACTLVFTTVHSGYLAVAVAALAFCIPYVLVVREAPIARASRPKLDFLGFWISPRKHPDFGWVLLGRVLVNVGNALGTGMLLYFLTFGLHLPDPESSMLLATLIYMIFVIVAALIGGPLSDRMGARRPFVFAASAIQGVAGLVLALFPTFPVTCVAAALMGIGYGSFMAVDQALATQVLPNAEDRGKDMGVMNIAYAAPQALAPAMGAAVVALTRGFPAMFVLAAVCAVAGALCIFRVRSVR